MFQVPSIHIIEPSDTIYESDEDDDFYDVNDNDESSFSDPENNNM